MENEMKQYSYSVSEGGRDFTGVIDAENEREATLKLTKKYGVCSWSVYLTLLG